jgi:DNA invertase Pin-like site-specific DNA recombinase
MFAAVYARYSSDLQRDASIEDQIHSCKARIDQEGWTLVASYNRSCRQRIDPFAPGLPEVA